MNRTPRRDLQDRAKRILAQGLAILPDVSVASLARALDESDSTVRAWCDVTRSNQPPLWLLGAPAFPPSLRVFVDDGLAVMRASGRAVASTEDQSNLCTGSVGDLLATIATCMAGDRYITAAEARDALPVAIAAQRAVTAFVERLQERAGVVVEARVVPLHGRAAS